MILLFLSYSLIPLSQILAISYMCPPLYVFISPTFFFYKNFEQNSSPAYGSLIGPYHNNFNYDMI